MSTQGSQEAKGDPKKTWEPKPFKHSMTGFLELEGGKKLSFEAVHEQILLDAPESKKKECAELTYTSYKAEGEARPIFFCFNGGPGAASLWLHMGAFGPKIISNLDITDAGKGQKLEANPHSLLPYGDCVFVDPVGTGISTYESLDLAKEFWNENGDVQSLASFIYKYLFAHKAWGRPVYLVGESYGGYRISLLCHELIDAYGIYPEGLFFVAPFLSGTSLIETPENIIAQANYLIAYIVTSWFHGRSSLRDTVNSEEEVYRIAKEFIHKEVLPRMITQPLPSIDKEVLSKLSEMLGVELGMLEESQGAFNVLDFSRYLFPGEAKYVGRLDSRFLSEFPLTFSPAYIDASRSHYEKSYCSQTQKYFSQEFGLETGNKYEYISPTVHENWVYKEAFLSKALDALSQSMKQNPKMKIYSVAGYYDLAVPASCVSYDLDHLPISDTLRKNIKLDFFPAGHMMYIQTESLEKLVGGAAAWFELSPAYKPS